MRFVPGPDLPTGGKIVGLDGIREAYETGRGAFRTRATARVENVTAAAQGHRRHRAALRRRPGAGHREDRRPGPAPRSCRASPTSRTSPTASKGLRLVIEVKNGFNPEAVLEQLYRLTPMEESFGINNVALVDGQPRTLGPQGAARGLRRPPARRRTPAQRVPPAQGRRTGCTSSRACSSRSSTSTRSSQSSASATTRPRPATRLMPVFDLTEIQANYILDMPLRRLTKFSPHRAGGGAGRAARARSPSSPRSSSPTRRCCASVVSDELAEVAKTFGTPRRTVLLESAGRAAHRGRARSRSPTTRAGCCCPRPGCSPAPPTPTRCPAERRARQARRRRVRGPRRPPAARSASVTSAGRMLRLAVLDLPALPADRERPEPAGGAPVSRVRRAGEGRAGARAGLARRRRAPGLALGTAQGVVKRVAPDYPANRDAWEVIGLKRRRPGRRRRRARDGRRGPGVRHLRRPAAALPGGRACGRRAAPPAAWPASGWRAGARVVFFGAVDPGGRRRRGRRSPARPPRCPAPRPARSRSRRTPSTPPRAAATGGVRCHRFLRGEDTLLARLGRGRARRGPPPPPASRWTCPTPTGRRDGSGAPASQPIAAVSGPTPAG